MLFRSVLDPIPLPRLLAEDGRVRQQIADFARRPPSSQTRIVLLPPSFCRCFPARAQHSRFLHPATKVARDLSHEDLFARLEPVEKRHVAAVKLVECPGRHADAVGQRAIDLRQCDLGLGAELDLVGNVIFFRRSGSLAQSSGRYTPLSSNT